ncbi:MAG TPA: YeeE/YedE thiosulfate transporter family protein [Gammaproteobacteria bacterium]|nr:YeeE/YedE thiosulfate transporter family protein [Gammaproteobacteria bacterium]
MKTGSFKFHVLYGLFGLLMGGTLARIGFADYDQVHRMFIFADMRLLFTFGGAVVFAGAVFAVLRGHLPYHNKTLQPGTVPGSILFGAGWAICGACPSIVFVQLGQGRLPALATLLGILFGVVLHKWAHARFFRWDTGTCGV